MPTGNTRLATAKIITVDMEFDEESSAFVTFVKQLHGMSTFGKSELDALENTAERIRGYVKSMDANGKKIPWTSGKLTELKHLLAIR